MSQKDKSQDTSPFNDLDEDDDTSDTVEVFTASFDRKAQWQVEYEHLLEIFSDLEGSKFEIAKKISHQLASSLVTMRVAAEYIDIHGEVDIMQQGTYAIRRKEPYFDIFQQSAASCSAAFKQLISLYPKEEKVKIESDLDGYQQFMKKFETR